MASVTAGPRRRDVIPAHAGIGLRFPHHQRVLDCRPDVGWFEVHTENYMGGGAPLRYLEEIRRDYPISLHGVGLSLGSVDGLNAEHLARICQVAKRIEPGFVSEHVSWSVSDGVYLGDLLPLPLTQEALDVVCCNVARFQDSLRRQILIENPSSYLRYRHSPIPEWEFMAAVSRRTGCGIVCDVNNIFVNASNHGWDPHVYLAALPAPAIKEVHLAGHAVRSVGDGVFLCVDDHGSHVSPAVWSLYADAIQRFGPVPTLIERDTRIPALEVLLEEAERAETILSRRDRVAEHAELA